MDNLISPCCHLELETANRKYSCSNCGTQFEYNRSGSLDLRLKVPKKIMLEFNIGGIPLTEKEISVAPLTPNPSPAVDFSGIKTPYHLTKEVLSYFPKSQRPASLMLDLGCGDGIHQSVCELAGFEWVGIDYSSAKAPILADGHALPFKSNVFDFLLSIAVLEHIRYPFVMMKEAFRVLKPGGIFIGTVAFLEPFHGDSFYHHTHLGLINCLHYGGFTVKKIAPNTHWPVLKAQASMGLFPQMPSWLSTSVIYPVHLLHRVWWGLAALASKKANENNRTKNTTGAFIFVVIKDNR